jgi:hypothetical protein
MGLNVFMLGNLVLCWSVMAAELILSFATESSATTSGLVQASYQTFAGLKFDKPCLKFDKPSQTLDKHFHSL